jgi:hypothetical protein
MRAAARGGGIPIPPELSDNGRALWARLLNWLDCFGRGSGTAPGMDMDDHRARLGRKWPVALAALLAMAPAWAQDSLSVKELLDRAQIKPQTEAVEDLIRKLKAGERVREDA